MPETRSRLAALIVVRILLTLFVAFGSASLAIWLGGDWDEFGRGLTLSLKIMWGSWVVLFVAALLTLVTITGWRYRKARLSDAPAALARAIAEGMKPAVLLKTSATSFTTTVILVSLLGVTVLASVLIWILGDWNTSASALTLSLKILWGTWWVLCIITVLVRVAIFRWQRVKAGYGRKPLPSETPDEGGDSQAGESQPSSTEPATGKAP